MNETPSPNPGAQAVTSDVVRHFFRDMDDHTVAAILALEPTIAQLEEAVTRMRGAEETFAGLRAEGGVVARIIELAGVEEAAGYDEEARPRGA